MMSGLSQLPARGLPRLAISGASSSQERAPGVLKRGHVMTLVTSEVLLIMSDLMTTLLNREGLLNGDGMDRDFRPPESWDTLRVCLWTAGTFDLPGGYLPPRSKVNFGGSPKCRGSRIEGDYRVQALTDPDLC